MGKCWREGRKVFSSVGEAAVRIRMGLDVERREGIVDVWDVFGGRWNDRELGGDCGRKGKGV